jgi:hypothetical protein
MASTCCLPLEGGFGLPFTIEGRPLTNGPFHGGGSWRTVAPRYFEVFRIPLLRGRMFTDRDDGGAAPVVLINEGLAKEFWQNSDPVGQRITIGKGVGPEFEEPPREIIGIVGDVRDQGLNNNPDPIMYIPVAQVKNGVTALNNRIIPITWVVRTDVEQRDSGGASDGEPRVAGSACPLDGTSQRGIYIAHRFQFDATGHFRRCSSAAGGHRHLRADCVLGATTDTGDRDSHGAGREPAGRAEDGSKTGNAARFDWRVVGRRGSDRTHAVDGQSALRSKSAGSGDTGFGSGGAFRCRSNGDLRSRFQSISS